MTSSSSTTHAPPKTRSRLAQGIGTAIAVVVLLFAGYEGTHFLFQEHAEEVSAQPPATDSTTVKIPPEKITQGNIQSFVLEPREMRQLAQVPATLSFNPSFHVQMRASVDCVVKQLQVTPGQWVTAGAPLAILSSGEMGTARIELSRCEDDLRLAEMQYNWAAQTHENLDALLRFLENRPELQKVEEEFQGKLLGKHREQLIASYSAYLLRLKDLERTQQTSGTQILSERTIDQRRSEFEIANANFTGVFEETQFESRRDLAMAKADRDAALRALEVAKENVQVLLGDFGQLVETERPNEFAITSPLEGQVAKVNATPSARFQPGETIFEVADTRTLWVKAYLSQDVAARLVIQKEEEIAVEIPALTQEPLHARFQFVASEVSPETLAIPLVASIDNTNNQLRPGMSAWVQLPVSAASNVLAVPEGSIQYHEGEAFVFVEEGTGQYRKVNVKVGAEANGWIEVDGPLKPGDRVVHEGAFFVKSELLLEAEE